jgi:hypothetical protein
VEPRIGKRKECKKTRHEFRHIEPQDTGRRNGCGLWWTGSLFPPLMSTVPSLPSAQLDHHLPTPERRVHIDLERSIREAGMKWWMSETRSRSAAGWALWAVGRLLHLPCSSRRVSGPLGCLRVNICRRCRRSKSRKNVPRPSRQTIRMLDGEVTHVVGRPSFQKTHQPWCSP